MLSINTPADAFWGLPSSKANFCEEVANPHRLMLHEADSHFYRLQDYVVTRYVAEFINSLTNLCYIIYAIYGLRQLQQKRNVEFARAIPYWGLMAVGICSAAFHISLQYHTQMLDDLSMLFTTTPLVHRVLTVNADRKGSFVTGLCVYLALALVVIYHVRTDELILHASFFVGSIAVIGIRTMQLLKRRTAENSAARRQLWGMVVFGAVIFHLGYIVWVVDGWVCDGLRSARAIIGLPWAWLLELHGWWHIFTGIGAYIFIAVIDQLLSGEDHDDIDGGFAWPASWASQSLFAGVASTIVGADDKKQKL
ncbi:uncharacterized protein N7503_011975 [Penicillium pulvis]|uniref:uncharacterized protein n=1 Tax=Penicillium pulvis TaxID=1562058 RepID=UPI002548105B|nr:uncharacterized protein N7503_011975 [Penicillium pulvis]KAJ5786763.1 hypothetical protein N7503_011975 [Penicillium pulvis]